jgi:hypothetical protein
MEYITRSNLIVGEISRLQKASSGNTSYELEFFGPTLDCETTNRSMETIILQVGSNFDPSDDSQEEILWRIDYPEPTCLLNASPSYDRYRRYSVISHRVAHHHGTLQYWPCLDKDQSMPTPLSSQDVDLPVPGIQVIVPMTETVCQPKIVKYHVTISDAPGAQNISHVFKDDEYIPEYVREFYFAPVPEYGQEFNGSFEQWTQFSDAIMIYEDFVGNLNRSGTTFPSFEFEYPSMSNETKPYEKPDGTVVETCVLEGKTWVENRTVGSAQDIWPLSVFEQRLHERGVSYECPAFDPHMANESLINTTISALALNQRFDMVNGTETRGFNAYHFENKLAFFLPYGLSLALAVPILVLGFIALYVQNHGVSAISGGFLQLLMTTTGRTSLEAVVTKGSGTLGGHENVSEELREMEVRFGELIEVSGEDQKQTDTLLNGHEEHADVQEDDRSQSDIGTTSGMERCENSVSVVQRAGFGTVDEVGPFKKKGE